MSGPLAGIQVLDLTVNVLGPFATQILGDAGADVIKIEAPAGDPMRKIGPSRTPDMGSYYFNANRNKRSVVLDLKDEQGREALRRLVKTADVLVHNMRVAAMERLGFGYDAVRALNPRIVYAAATGFRRSSSASDRGAFDDIVQGWTGLAALNRGSDGAPRFVPTVMADKITGMALASAIGMALFARERTGEGQQLHVPMVDTLVQFTLIEHLWGATLQQPELGLGYGRMLSPHRRPYPTRDGHITVLAVTDEQWRRLFAAIGRPELIEDKRFATLTARTANVDTMLAMVAEALRARPTAEWTVILDKADVPNGAVNTLEDLLDDPYLAETGFFQPADHPTEGRVTLMAIPAEYDGTPAAIRRLPPQLGEHTAEVLAEIGLSASESAAARR
jgi:crotonobetainyl-CoA:carnitine CoA-transferase CaiB-like acyl-CoA transferase